VGALGHLTTWKSTATTLEETSRATNSGPSQKHVATKVEKAARKILLLQVVYIRDFLIASEAAEEGPLGRRGQHREEEQVRNLDRCTGVNDKVGRGDRGERRTQGSSDKVKRKASEHQ